MKLILTKWIAPSVKPVRKGWYQASLGPKHPLSAEGMASKYNWFWDGVQWLDDKNGLVSMEQERWWRGRYSP